MITTFQITHSINAQFQKEMPFGFGNTLFAIAGTIGIAEKQGYEFGFGSWCNQEYFVHPLPRSYGMKFKPFNIPATYKGYDIGFCGFHVPDDSAIRGYMGSERILSIAKTRLDIILR